MDKLICIWLFATTIFLVLTNVTGGEEMQSNRCASTCKCDGQKVDCSDRYLYQIPDLTIMQTYIHSLNFSNNEIETLTTSNFVYYRLGKLQELQLDQNSIYDIEETAFDFLPDLTYLDISNNLLESVSDRMVEKNTKLLQLNLAQNMFNEKTPKLISKSIEYLDLSNCKISHLDVVHIKNLPSLKILNLNANRLTHIPHHIFDDLPLTSVGLSYNYWKCSCDSLRFFHHLIHFKNITIENSIQCLHENNIFEDLIHLDQPVHNKPFCANKSYQINHTKEHETHKLHHKPHYMIQKHKEVEKQEEGGFNQNCAIFTITIVGVVTVSLIASVVAWKITSNKKIRPIDHIYEEPSKTLLIQRV